MSPWIKATDQLPPVGVQILAYGKNRGELCGGVGMDICVWDGDCWWDEGGTESSWRPWEYWMPLPPPPEKP